MGFFDNKLTILGEVMEINYDLHLHTALSPCALEEMTPNNLVNMSLISDLDVIAVTDHNSCENVAAVMKVAEETGLIVIPGIEVETQEEIHIVCLFETLQAAYQLQDVVYRHLPQRRNNAKIFGNQLLLDHEDEEIGRLDRLLSFATGISIDDLVETVRKIGGVCIPAHIDRPSYSIISNLGMLPEHLSFPVLEISRHSKCIDFEPMYKDHLLIQSSDAHELGFVGICESKLQVTEKSIQGVFEVLRGN